MARDDCSSDDTPRLLAEWGARLGERCTVLRDPIVRNLGVAGSFTAVLRATSSRWVMTADPDDVWLPGKIGASLAAMQETERRLGEATPIAVCTDARVVDRDLKTIAPSYWRHYRMTPCRSIQLPRTAVENVALGSTMMVNRALVDLALPIDAAAAYQDWWLALAAAAFGEVVALPEQTMLYRRHGANETDGPYSASLPAALLRGLLAPGGARQRMKGLLIQAANQARAFVTRYRDRLDARTVAALEALAALPSQSWLERRATLIRHDLWFGAMVKNLGLMALI